MDNYRERDNARAAIYTRISKDLTLEGLGVARQRTDCRALVAKFGWTTVEEFEDNDISASGGKSRPDYEKLKALMEVGGVDVVVVYAADRLHRNSRELEDWIDLAARTGGGYSLRGYSKTGSDPKHDSFNTGLEYDSAKGFTRG